MISRDKKTFSGYNYTFEGFTFLKSGIYPFKHRDCPNCEHKYSTEFGVVKVMDCALPLDKDLHGIAR